MFRMDSSVLKERLADTAKLLEAESLAALVVFAHGSALGSGSKSHGYMRYLTDWDGHNTPSLFIFVPGQEPTLLTPNIFLKFMGGDTLWFDDIRFVKPPSFGTALKDVLDKAGVSDGKIGLVGRDEMFVSIWDGIAESLPNVAWQDFQHQLDRRRVVKDALQLGFHRRAAEICDDMFTTLSQEVRSGKPTYRIQAEMERTARLAGAEYVLTWLTIGPIADYCRFHRDECLRVPQKGDQILAGIYLLHNGHWGHAIRMGTYGTPTDAHRKVFDVAYQMQEAGLEKLRPGGNLYDVNAAFDRVMEQYFPNAIANGVFTFRPAHGLGHSYEDPIASQPFPQSYDETASAPAPDAFLEITEGMLFEFHPNLFVPDFAGAALGDMVAVTKGAPEIMTHYPRELAEW